MSALMNLVRIGVQFDNAKRRYRRYGIVGRTVALIGQLICAAATAVGAWGLSKCLALIGSAGVIIPIVLAVVCAAATLAFALWTVLFVIAYVPVLLGEIKKHNSASQADGKDTPQDGTAADSDVPRMAKAVVVIFIILNLITVPIAIAGALVMILQL